MGGNVLELESDRLIQQGVTRGEEQQALKSARLMLIDGKLSLEEISRFSGLEQERIKQLKKKRTCNKKMIYARKQTGQTVPVCFLFKANITLTGK